MPRREFPTEMAAQAADRRPSSVPKLREMVDAIAQRLGFASDLRGEIGLAVAEACNNAVLYGAGETLSLRCRRRNGFLEIEIATHGAAFSPTAPATMPDALAEHGRGRALMEQMMDRVEYICRDGDMAVRLRKRLPRPR